MQLVLTIPDEMTDVVDQAIRSAYAGVVAPEMDSVTAMHAVARFWLSSLMADYAAQQARAAGDQQVQAAMAARDQAVEDAATSARAQIDAIPWPDVP